MLQMELEVVRKRTGQDGVAQRTKRTDSSQS